MSDIAVSWWLRGVPVMTITDFSVLSRLKRYQPICLQLSIDKIPSTKTSNTDAALAVVRERRGASPFLGQHHAAACVGAAGGACGAKQ
eukprot:6172996-Pleurochrysis_carterae.AAC.2